MLPQDIQSKLLNEENYVYEWSYSEDKVVTLVRYCTVDYKGRKIIGNWSERRAKKDKNDRDEKIEKAIKLLEKPGQLSKKAKMYFIKGDANHKYQLDTSRIEIAQKFHGYLGISTNATQIKATEILDHYRHLFQIEQAFQTFKSHLETRPMFHWTPIRIEGHMCLCYISYTVHNY